MTGSSSEVRKDKIAKQRNETNFGELADLDSDDGVRAVRPLEEDALVVDQLVGVAFARLDTSTMPAPVPSLSARASSYYTTQPSPVAEWRTQRGSVGLRSPLRIKRGTKGTMNPGVRATVVTAGHCTHAACFG